MPRTLRFASISSLVLGAFLGLSGTALADSSPSAAKPPPSPPSSPPSGAGASADRGPTQMLRLTLVVKAGAETRTHELAISDVGCGSISDKAAAYEDQIRVCSRHAASGLVIDTEWSTRTGPSEYRTRSEMLLARAGGTGEIGRTGGHRLVVTVR
jgi:hypothetical protein